MPVSEGFVKMDAFRAGSYLVLCAHGKSFNLSKLRKCPCQEHPSSEYPCVRGQVGDGAPEDYYRVHAPYTGVYTFSTCGSGFDTYVHVYTIENATSSTLGRQVGELS